MFTYRKIGDKGKRKSRFDNYDEKGVEENEVNWWSLIFCGYGKGEELQLEIWGLLWLVLVVLSIIAVNETGKICDDCWEVYNLPNGTRTDAQLKTMHDTCQEIVINLWHHNSTECEDQQAVLLSRAFTTLGWARGFAIGYSLLSIMFISMTPVPLHRQRPLQIFIKIPLIIALLIFSSAFEVSMFDGHAHGVLIGMASILGVLFTIPGPLPFLPANCCKACYRHDKMLCHVAGVKFKLRAVWWFLWSFMIVSNIIFVSFWLDSYAEFERNGWDTNRAPKLRSGYYWFEYLFFWTMYLLVGYAIGAEEATPYREETREFSAPKPDAFRRRQRRTDFYL